MIGRPVVTSMKTVEEALFHTVCTLFQELEAIKNSRLDGKRLKYQQALNRFYSTFQGGDLFSLFRLLVPEVRIS